MNEHLKNSANTIANIAVDEVYIATAVALSAVGVMRMQYITAAIAPTTVAVGATPAAMSNAKCRIMFKTVELSCNRNENRKGRLIFKFLRT